VYLRRVLLLMYLVVSMAELTPHKATMFLKYYRKYHKIQIIASDHLKFVNNNYFLICNTHMYISTTYMYINNHP
jgi:hypothetical protein